MLGWDTDAQLLDKEGVGVEQLGTGCCGLAGNFGFERNHLCNRNNPVPSSWQTGGHMTLASDSTATPRIESIRCEKPG